MNNDDFIVYCFPISGGAFISQLGLLSEYYDANLIASSGKLTGSKSYQPDIVFSASGGNIATFIALAGDWSSSGIKRILPEINSEMFAKSWMPKELYFIPTWIIGSFKGTLYKKGSGCSELFNRVFTEDTMSRVEIWIGTYDKKNDRAQFFCNLNEEKCYIKSINFSFYENQFHTMPLKYCDCNITKISNTCLASASIPMFVEPIEIDGVEYCDGGLMYASPIGCMSSQICTIVTENKKRLKLVYFSSYDIENYTSKEKLYEDDFENFRKTLRQIVHTSCIQDKTSAIDILYKISEGQKIHHFKYEDLNTTKLSNILLNLKSFTHYVLVLYPKICQIVPIVGFTESDLFDKLKYSKINYGANVWAF